MNELNFNLTDFLQKDAVYILTAIYKKNPIEIISDIDLKNTFIKIVFEMVKVGHSLKIEFANNFVNNTVLNSSNLEEKIIDIEDLKIKLELIIQIAVKNNVRISKTKEILNLLKDNNG